MIRNTLYARFRDDPQGIQKFVKQGLYSGKNLGYNKSNFRKEVDHMSDSFNSTIKFTVPSDDKDNMRRILRSVFDALNEKGYNPINQIVGYLLTEDPTYITNYNNARSMICKLDRDELMQALVRCYLSET